MNDLYSIEFPCEGLADVQELYFHGKLFLIDETSRMVRISENGILSFGTYFNSFSLEKWKKYTNLNDLYLSVRVKGRFKISVSIRYLIAGDYLTRIISKEIYESDGPVLLNLTNSLNQPGILFFAIEPMEESCVFYEAKYCTNSTFVKPNIATIICTFKRETYVQKFMENFERYSRTTKNLYAFIADNGNTLPQSKNDKITIFKNKNYGGAGGFGRGMIEVNAYNRANKDRIDYIVLMDDDIFIDFSVFNKLSSFLALRKPEFNNYFLAGSMCSLDYPHLQYERYSKWNGDGFTQVGANYDLRNLDAIVTNEREDRFNLCTAGWWFSCFSSKLIEHNNYPFPCFFRGDDMEFTIRNGSRIMTLNGINVWHEPFYKKYSSSSENYYLFRNSLVINALYYPEFSAMRNIKFLGKRFLRLLFTMDYKGAELILKAWKDSCKGVDFFANTDPEALNKELMSYNAKLVPISELLEEYQFEAINSQMYGRNDRSRVHKLFRRVTLNGLMIPKCFYKPFDFALIGFGGRIIDFYKRKNVCILDPFSWKGYVMSVSKGKIVKLSIEFLKQSISYCINYRKIIQNYQKNFYTLQTEEFWNKYLK